MIPPPRLIPFVLAGLLAGCSVGPDYHPPKSAAPAQWASPLAGGETNLPSADAAWWKSFHDAELDSLVLRAAQSNLNLRAALARVREARAAARVVSADLAPTLDAAGAYARNRYSANGVFPFPPGMALEDNVYQAGFDAAWELDVFGGTRRAAQAARAEIAAAEYGRRVVVDHPLRRSRPRLRRSPRLPAPSGRGQRQHPGPAGNPRLDPRPLRQRIDRRIGRAGSRRPPGHHPRAGAAF